MQYCALLRQPTQSEPGAFWSDAKDDDTKGFCAHFDIEPGPSDPYHLLLVMKDVLKNIGKFGT
jgi:hypothetical protein